MVQPEFGRRLRRARLDAQMSQLELAGDAYTNSYVSYLESGRRAPTSDVAAYLAARLGTTPAALGFVHGDATDLDTRIALELLVGDKAIGRHEWVSALAAANRALELASRSPRRDRTWEATHLKCRILIESGDFAAAAELAAQMAGDELSDLSPLLKAESLTLAARALRGCGQLEDAAVTARAALDVPDLDETLEVEGLLQLIAARAELGHDPVELTPEVARLETVAQQLELGHTRGRVLWTIGNIAYLIGDAERGATAHAQAASMISATVDLALFGRLHRVIAHYRLSNRDIDGVAHELAVARQAAELVGRPSDLVELAVEEARLMHLQGGNAAALDEIDAALASTVMAIPFVGRAETLELRGDVLVALGRGSEAKAAYVQAAEDYEAMNALPRALSAWRLAAGELGPSQG